MPLRPASEPPTRPALRARYDTRQSELVTAAAGVFAARGYDQTSIHELAAQIGLAAGGIYHYFGGKEQLLIAICDQLMDPLLTRAEELAAEDRDAEEHLRRLVLLWVTHVVAHRDHMLVFQQERHVIDHGEQWREVRERRKRFERLVEAALTAVQASGSARFADRRVALSALLGMVNHTAQWFRPDGRLDADGVAAGYVELLLT